MLHAAMPHIRKRPDGCLESIHARAVLRQTRGNPIRGGPGVTPGQTIRTLRAERDGVGKRSLADCAFLLDGRWVTAPCAKGEGR